MKKLSAFILPMLLLGSGIALAFHVQDDPICSEREHIGYSYTGTMAPPLPFNPEAPLPAGLTEEGRYDVDFSCETNAQQICHWAYVPAQNPNEQGEWIRCTGNISPLD